MGVRLIWGTQDNVFSWERMKEFAAFLGQHGVPCPLAGAVLSVAVQFLAGVPVILGLWTRAAGALIVLNFIAALWIAHRGDTFLNMYDALVMLAGGLFFFCTARGACRSMVFGGGGSSAGARRRQFFFRRARFSSALRRIRSLRSGVLVSFGSRARHFSASSNARRSSPARMYASERLS